MIDFAYRHGIIITIRHWFYHDGQSEEFIGGALKPYPRDRVFLADKMPTPVLESLNQAKDIFQTQLDRCQVTYFDNYMLHSLTSREEFDRLYIREGILEYLRQEKSRGRIRCLGFFSWRRAFLPASHGPAFRVLYDPAQLRRLERSGRKRRRARPVRPVIYTGSAGKNNSLFSLWNRSKEAIWLICRHHQKPF